VLLTNAKSAVEYEMPNVDLKLTRLVLRTTKKFSINALEHINKIVGVQPLAAPCGIIYHMHTSGGEKNDNKHQLSIEVTSSTVEALTRATRAHFTVELMQDLERFHGIDAVEEVSSALSDELMAEYMSSILDELSTDAREVECNADQLLLTMQEEATKIAIRTQRGAANFAIIPHNLVGDLIDGAYGTPDTLTIFDEIVEHSSTLHQFGTFGNMKLLYARSLSRCDLIIGYRGSFDVDAGKVICPFVPVALCGQAVNVETFTPSHSIKTRYGKWNADNVCDYYTKITLTS
jgi:hypothetical protein